MSKPATKDPSMDEILSSIRQIIADDDEPDNSVVEEATTVPVADEVAADAQMAALAEVETVEDVPLELSADQMIATPAPDTESAVDTGPVVGTEPEDEAAPAPEAGADADLSPAGIEDMTAQIEEAIVAEPAAPLAMDEPGNPIEDVKLVVADDIAFDDDEPVAIEEEPAPAAAMPDPDLSAHVADKLLAPATDAAVRHTFSKLGTLSMGGADLTLEAIVRDMLRPILKEWLDENLPATVERMVEREIERVSRGE